MQFFYFMSHDCFFLFVDQHVDVQLHPGGRGGHVTFVPSLVYGVRHRRMERGRASLVTPPAPAAGSHDVPRLGRKEVGRFVVFFCVCVCVSPPVSKGSTSNLWN